MIQNFLKMALPDIGDTVQQTRKQNASQGINLVRRFVHIYTYRVNLGELLAVVQVFRLKLVFALHILVLIVIIQIAEISQTG